jgi:lipoprotein-releasing system permease protein
MNARLIVQVAWALMMARWRQTLVAAIGVTFSIAMFIVLLSFMNGLNDLLDGLMMNRTAHVRLYNEVRPSDEQPINRAAKYAEHHNFIRSVKPRNELQRLHNSGIIISTLKTDDRVMGVAPKVTAQVFFNVGTTDITGVVNGIDVEAEARLFVFNDYIVSGNSMDVMHTQNSIILGIGAARRMMAEVGDMVQVTTSRGDRLQLKVVGYFQSGIQEVDAMQSYASIATVQKLLGENSSYITDIQVKLKDVNLSVPVAQEYARMFDVDVVDFFTANAIFETGSSVRTLISYAVGITLLVVAGFGIYNILNMMIYEKMDSIAILKATGFSGRDVNSIFIAIALSIGIFGAALGMLFGLGLTALIDQIPFNTTALPTIKTYPINYDPMFYLIGTVFALVTTYFAGYLPARKASKVDPVDIIRGK